MELKHLDRVNQSSQGNSTVSNRQATPFPQVRNEGFPPLVAMNFKGPDNEKTSVCHADARVTRSAVKATPRRSPRLVEGHPPRQVHFEPKMTTPKQTSRSSSRRYTSPSSPPAITEEGGMQEEDDIDETCLPRTFPLRDIGSPTPGTTYLGEPPEGELPPPPYRPPMPRRTPKFRPAVVSGPLYISTKQSCDTASSLCRSIDMVKRQAVALQNKLSQEVEEERQNERTPLSVLMVYNDTVSDTMSEHYCEAQTFAGMMYAMATIKTQ